MRVYCEAKTCANNIDLHCVRTDSSGVNCIKISSDARCANYLPVHPEEAKSEEGPDR